MQSKGGYPLRGARFDQLPLPEEQKPRQMTLNEQQNVMADQRLIGASRINWVNDG